MRVRTQERREAIIEAAARLFEEVGYEAASMNELAKRLGGSKATLYGYFPSKEQLLVAVVQAFATAHLSEATSELLSALEKKPALKPTLTRFGDRALQVLANDRSALAIYRVVVTEAGRSDVGALFHETGPRQSIEALANFMGIAMKNGDIRKADPQVTAMQFMSLLTAEIGARIFLRDSPPVAAAEIHRKVERAVDFFLMGAAPREAPPSKT